MSYPFVQGISDIQETEAMTGSRASATNFSSRSNFLGNHEELSNYEHDVDQLLTDNRPEEPSFFSLRDYIQKTLGSWGLKVGYMTEDYENKVTVDCLVKMITHRFAQQQNREQLKKTLSEAVFQRNKYQSLLEQERVSNGQKNKSIGKLQNTIAEMKMKIKQIEQSTKKEKDEDKKMLSMLKSKNEQLMHEIKKKQQETNRIKEQIKKNVGEKSVLKNVTFEVYEVCKKQQGNLANDKFNLLSQKYESQRKSLMRENVLLREKIYDIREEIVKFAQWIDINIFRQQTPNYKNKMIVNHNMLFKKESLVEELNEILEDAKSGIKEIINMHEEVMKLQSPQKSQRGRLSDSVGYGESFTPNLKKKATDYHKIEVRQALPQQKKNVSLYEKTKQKVPTKPINLPETKRERKSIAKFVSQEPSFIEQESQISMISHVSISDMINENEKLEKWDILFNQQ